MLTRIILAFWLLAAALSAATDPRVELTADGWSGLKSRNLIDGGTASFRYPEGKEGVFKTGFRVGHDGTRDWRRYEGLEVEVVPDRDSEVELELTVRAPAGLGADERTTGSVRFLGSRRLFISWDVLDFPKARTSWKRFVLGIDLKARYLDGKGGSVNFKSVSLVMAPAVSLECDVRGKPAAAGGHVDYEIHVGNPSPDDQSIILKFVGPGWQAMKPTVEPAVLYLKTGEIRTCRVRVEVPDSLNAGASEKQILQAVGNGDASRASRMEFITGVTVPQPYIVHTATEWEEVRDKVERIGWARKEQQKVIKRAMEWTVPEVAKPPGNDPDDTWGPYLFKTEVRHDLMACGIAWQLTRDRSFADKAALFFRRLSSPENGYPTTLRATAPNQVQEGQLFQSVAMVYDMIADAGVLEAEDRARVDGTLRIFMENMERLADSGSINNWNVAEATGAILCALAMQDLVAADRWFTGPGGICEQLRIGTMDDGWWYECSVGYNIWVATQFTQVALAYRPWGVNFKDISLPASYVRNILLEPELNGGKLPRTDDPAQLAKPYGMDPDVGGPLRRPFRQIKDLWDGMIPFIDWRGVIFGVNDSAEISVVKPLEGLDPNPFDLAYYVYRDPQYASVVQRGGLRDLLYGVPDFPADLPEPFRESAVADSVGLAMLRSKAPGRPIHDQIQAVMHFGTHGWAHGHFDHTGLMSLMRYGRSFYNPKSVWHGYERFLYKFYVQTSVAKNMVVVDRKMQQSAPDERILYHAGDMMQAVGVEVVAPWSYPPYGGMIYDYVPVDSFQEKAWREGRFMPVPEVEPGYGEMTGFTEPIKQRRVMMVFDDYVVIADQLEGTRDHEFECLYQMKGFLGLEAPERKYLGHSAQWDADPLGGAQFVTDCNRFAVTAPAISRFEMKFGHGADNVGTIADFSEDGSLRLDVHTLWPLEQEIMFGTVPEHLRIGQRVFHEVRGDGNLLAEGKLGAWVLGASEIDVPLTGVTTLELESRVDARESPSLFWAEARVVTAGGREIPLSELDPTFSNIRRTREPKVDYRGGLLKIAGEKKPFATPAQPQDHYKPGVVKVDLAGLDAVRFKATLGSDFPSGPEAQRRKTMAVKAPVGKEARFLTLIEPYETESVVESAVALSDSKLRVTLRDGRVQEISLGEKDGAVSVKVVESRDGKILRSESNQNPPHAEPFDEP